MTNNTINIVAPVLLHALDKISSLLFNDLTLQLEQPTIIGVPHNASGSGSIGNLGYGPTYYAANHNQSAGLFIKQIFARFKRLGNNPDTSLQLGRFTFSDGAETTPADPSMPT